MNERHSSLGLLAAPRWSRMIEKAPHTDSIDSSQPLPSPCCMNLLDQILAEAHDCLVDVMNERHSSLGMLAAPSWSRMIEKAPHTVASQPLPSPYGTIYWMQYWQKPKLSRRYERRPLKPGPASSAQVEQNDRESASHGFYRFFSTPAKPIWHDLLDAILAEAHDCLVDVMNERHSSLGLLAAPRWSRMIEKAPHTDSIDSSQPLPSPYGTIYWMQYWQKPMIA